MSWFIRFCSRVDLRCSLLRQPRLYILRNETNKKNKWDDSESYTYYTCRFNNYFALFEKNNLFNLLVRCWSFTLRYVFFHTIINQRFLICIPLHFKSLVMRCALWIDECYKWKSFVSLYHIEPSERLVIFKVVLLYLKSMCFYKLK